MIVSRQQWLCAAAIALVAAALYWPTWSFGFSYLDDNQLILEQAQWLGQPGSLLRAFARSYFNTPNSTYYRPVVGASFVLNGLVAGTQPFGYHFVNGLLHAFASMLVFALLVRVLNRALPALIGALLFAVSPVNTATVAWIPGRNDSLLVCLSLAALLLLLRNSGRPAWPSLVGHFLCFLGALFTKETALCLPLVFGLVLFSLGGKAAWSRRHWLWAGWTFAIVVYCGARMLVLTPAAGYYGGLWQTALARWSLPTAELGKLFLPVRLQVIAAAEDVLLWPGLVAAVTVGSLVLLLPAMRTKRLLLASAIVFLPLLMNVPASQTVVLENRLYLPMVGVALFVGQLVMALGALGPTMRHATTAVMFGVLALQSTVSLKHSKSFQTRDTFAQAAITASPSSGIAAHLMFRRSYAPMLNRAAKPK